MGRFDVYRLTADVPLVVEVQADLLSHLATTVVIPLQPEVAVDKTHIPSLNPLVRVAGGEYRLITPQIATLPRSTLGPCLGSIEDQRTVVVNAIDFLLQGF